MLWSELIFGVCLMKAEVFLPDDYIPADDEPFMNSTHVEYFTRKLLSWKSELMSDNKDTIETLQDNTRAIPDISDRASEETDRALELRTRDRQRKLVAKIDSACAELRRANMVTAKRLVSRFRCVVSMHVRLLP